MADKKTLQEALQFLLEGDGYLDRLEAQALLDVIRSDGKVTEEEREFLCETLETANLEGAALKKIEDFLAEYQNRTGA
ncbi:hypothetical protein D3C72_906550 [compost metagenome]